MVKGIGAGLVSGGFVGTVVMAMLSLYAPLAKDPIASAPVVDVETQQSEAVTPEASGKNAAPEANLSETVAAEPQDNTAPVVAADLAEANPADVPEEAEVVEAEVVEPEVTASEADTAQAAAQLPTLEGSPSVEGADSPTAEIASSDARASGLLSDTPSVQAETGDEIVVARADPESAPAAVTETDEQTTAAQSAPSTEVTGSTVSPTVQPSALEAPTVIGTEQPAEETAAAPSAPKLPTITTPDVIGGAEIASADTPITLPTVDSSVVTNRLPSINGAGAPEPEAPSDTSTISPEADVDLGALRTYGTTVEGIEGKALFGVILIDSGEDGIPREDLLQLSVPVTIAIDPTADNAQEIMEAYRGAGIEIVAIANELPTASSPSDVAVAVEAYFTNLPQSVGIMDPLDGRIQSNRSLLQPVLGAIRNSGHGLITYDRGLNTAQQAARREDIPAATVFRVLDADLEEGPKIKRYLDRAAFNANRDGKVVVVGRSYPETVKAIVEWVLEKKESGIAMVPVSAVMLADEAP
ncbi:MAG: divergent polysaccharide deacetylase family protein [Litoreibacter sp.]|uniref:divergent polysaccharide deacetylase family protein n=1 Tax=Litoreibacter sp. TaxID=1969459 RepID=UPI00329892C7